MTLMHARRPRIRHAHAHTHGAFGLRSNNCDLFSIGHRSSTLFDIFVQYVLNRFLVYIHGQTHKASRPLLGVGAKVTVKDTVGAKTTFHAEATVEAMVGVKAFDGVDSTKSLPRLLSRSLSRRCTGSKR